MRFSSSRHFDNLTLTVHHLCSLKLPLPFNRAFYSSSICVPGGAFMLLATTPPLCFLPSADSTDRERRKRGGGRDCSALQAAVKDDIWPQMQRWRLLHRLKWSDVAAEMRKNDKNDNSVEDIFPRLDLKLQFAWRVKSHWRRIEKVKRSSGFACEHVLSSTPLCSSDNPISTLFLTT